MKIKIKPKNTTSKADKSGNSTDYSKGTAIQSSKMKSLTTRKKYNTRKKDTDTTNNNLTIQSGKRPQFSMNLNLKQKFCNIFRFGKPQRFKNLAESTEYISPRNEKLPMTENTEKIQFRALPPLPTKGIVFY